MVKAAATVRLQLHGRIEIILRNMPVAREGHSYKTASGAKLYGVGNFESLAVGGSLALPGDGIREITLPLEIVLKVALALR